MAEERHCSECGGKLPADAPQGLCPQCLMKLGLPTGAEADKKDSPDDKRAIPTSATPPGGFVPPEPAELAKQFPQLEILELLGQGGMGAVYKARQKQLDRLVALKILPPEVGQTEAFAERFTREARSMAMLNHPQIVTLYEFGHTADGLYYFIMEFVDGTDLRRVIEGGELNPTEALAIVPQICEALQYAHEEGIVHRDIKPENVLLDKKGRVKIADFGLAKLLDRPASTYTLTQAGQRMGTPHYMAPEQIEHPHEVDHRADIFSLGVVFYEMLTGELPLGRFAPPSQKVQVDVRLDEIVLHTLEKEPELRYQHASEIKTDVETIAAEPQAPKAYIREAPAQRRFSRVAIVGACWAPFFFLLIVPAVLFAMPVYRFTGPDGGPTPRTGVGFLPLVITIPFLLLGLSAPFGTTILGFISITHIRHSAGRLYGIGLALFDALLFPLLALDVVLCLLIFISARELVHLDNSLEPVLILIYLLVCGVVDFLIIWWAWRKATTGLPTRHETTPAPTEIDEKEAIRQQVKRPAIGLLVVGILNWLCVLVWVAFALMVRAEARQIELRSSRLRLVAPAQMVADMSPVTVWLIALVMAGAGVFVIFAAIRMKRLQFEGGAIAAGILVMLIPPANLIGLPIGIWALSVLTRRDVKQGFGKRAGAEPSAAELSEAELIRQQVKRPAIGLLVTGIVNWVGITVAVLILTPIMASKQQAHPDPEAALWLVAAIAIVFSGLIFFAALKMMRLEAYPWAIAGSILAMITTPGNIIGLPIGVWALVVLTSRQVKEAFPRQEKTATQLRVSGPSIGLFAAALIFLASGLITGLVIMAQTRVVDSWEVGDLSLGTTVFLIPQVMAVLVACLFVVAAVRMRLLSSRGLALAAGVLCLIPLTPGWLLTLPIGIWVLSVLAKPEVKAAFPRKKRAVDLSKQGKWNAFCIAALPISLVGIFFSIREMDPGEDVRVRIIWGSSVVLSSVLAIVGLVQARKYQGMRCNGFGIAALVIALAALVGFVVTIYYPVGW